MRFREKMHVKELVNSAGYILLSLVVSAVLIRITGKDPFMAIGALFQGALGGKRAVAETLLKTVPLLFCGLSVAIAYRASFFNIGAEGQFLVGALSATAFGMYVQLPAILMIPATMAAGAIAGGFWCVIAGWLKVKTGAYEVINTIMLNYIALRLVGWAVNGPLKEGYLPQSGIIAKTAVLPIMWTGTRLHVGFLFALIFAVLLYLVLFKTVFGYQIQAVGLNMKAADYSGIKSSRRILQTCFISGAFAGIGGAVELMGVTQRLYEIFSPGYGFDAIAVSLLAKNNPLSIIASAFMFGVLRGGAGQMQRVADVSVVIIYVIQALIIVFVLVSSEGKRTGVSLMQRIRMKMEKA